MPKVEAYPQHIQCNIRDDRVDVLYNPTIGANIMSASFASSYFGNEPIAPTNKCLRIAPRINLKGCGVLHNMSVYHNNVEMALDFHVFDITDFDILIGHPLEKLFLDLPKNRGFERKVGERRLYHSYHSSQKLDGRISPPS